jgi:hypothetical protein
MIFYFEIIEIFNFFWEKSKKIKFVLLFNFTFFVYFWSMKIFSPPIWAIADFNAHRCFYHTHVNGAQLLFSFKSFINDWSCRERRPDHLSLKKSSLASKPFSVSRSAIPSPPMVRNAHAHQSSSNSWPPIPKVHKSTLSPHLWWSLKRSTVKAHLTVLSFFTSLYLLFGGEQLRWGNRL